LRRCWRHPTDNRQPASIWASRRSRDRSASWVGTVSRTPVTCGFGPGWCSSRDFPTRCHSLGHGESRPLVSRLCHGLRTESVPRVAPLALAHFATTAEVSRSVRLAFLAFVGLLCLTPFCAVGRAACRVIPGQQCRGGGGLFATLLASRGASSGSGVAGELQVSDGSRTIVRCATLRYVVVRLWVDRSGHRR